MKNTIAHFINRYFGWTIVFILVAIPLIRWFQINSADLAFSSGYGFFSMAGRLAGLAGIVLYAIDFMLSTRLRLLESLFGGLNRVYIAHHLIGASALIALLIHPLALAFRYVPDQMRTAAEFLLPSVTTPIDWPINFGFVAFTGLVLLLFITFFVRLPYELWLFTHRFLGLAFLFGGLHTLLIQSDTSNDLFLRWYILTITLVGISAFVYRSLLSRVFVRTDSYIVKRVENPADNVVHIIMQPTKKLLNYKPGQFVFISFQQDGISSEAHPFSISSAPTEDYHDPESIELTITVKALGDYTTTLLQLQEGTRAEIEGAFGRFTNTRYNEPKQIWIAGGIGITPFLSMAKSLTRNTSSKQQQYEIHLFYAVRTSSELLELEALQEIAQVNELNFHLHPYVGDQQERMISADFISKEAGGHQAADIFICGPPPMMKSLKHQFMDFGVKKRKIHTEEFSISS